MAAAVLGLGLGVAGGMLLGGQLFQAADLEDFSHIDQSADTAARDVTQIGTCASPAEARAMMPYLPKWLSEPDFDRVRWLNRTVAGLWPTLARAIHDKVMEEVTPILEDIVRKTPMLDTLTIERLDLGDVPITLGGIKSFDCRDDQVVVETQVLWGSSAKIHVSARVRIGPVSIYVPLKVEDVTVTSEVRVTARPLVQTLPCVGAVSVCLLQTPYVDGVVKAIMDMDLMSIPFLHNAVTLVLDKVCTDMCVFPKQIAVALMPNCGMPKPLCGMLELRVIKIDHLKGTETVFGKGDPYVRMSVVHYNEAGDIVKQGPFHHTNALKSKDPEYDEVHRILIEDVGIEWVLRFEVLDYDLIAPPDLMCQYDLPLDADGECVFLREPLVTCDMVVSLESPEMRGGQLQVENLDNIISFGWSQLQLDAQAGVSYGELHLNALYVPFAPPDAHIDEEEENPLKQVEDAQLRRIPRKISAYAKGVLTVRLTRVTDLPLIHGRECDSYVELKLTDPELKHPEVQQTEVMTNDSSPSFFKEFDFVCVSATSQLVVSVFHRTGTFDLSNLLRLSHEDLLLGKVRIPVKDVVKSTRLHDVFALQDSAHGDVHMSLEWRPVIV